MSIHKIGYGLLSIATLAVATVCSTSEISASHRAAALQEKFSMKPSVTHLHLLRHTPFFSELNTDQLRYVIQHSREWEARTGGLIVSHRSPQDDAGYWVLLDGGWELNYLGHVHASGHTDPGKWFNPDQLVRQDFKLTANDHSYVMHISTKDMDEMLDKGFNFNRHLLEGRAFYSDLVGSEPRHSAD